MRRYSLMFLRFLEHASGLCEEGKNSFGIPYELLDEARRTEWFTHHKDWDCFTQPGREEALRTLSGVSFTHGRTVQLAYTPYRCLPHYAKVAIERLDADNNLRKHDDFMRLLEAYAGSYGEAVVDPSTRASAENVCLRRFEDYRPFVPNPKPAGDGVSP